MRMYHIVMYNLSPIQKGIQAGHAALEYVEAHGSNEDYRDFIKNHKTWIILDGGGSNEIKEHLFTLSNLEIKFAKFVEPDLNDAVSCVTFLVPNKIYEAKFESESTHRYLNSSIDQAEWRHGSEILTPKEVEFRNWLNTFRLAK